MAAEHGRERLIELTLTMPGRSPKVAKARACLRALGKATENREWLAVFHAGDENGRPHFHLLTVAAGGAVRAEFQREAVVEWRRLAKRAGFGVVDGAPVRSLERFTAYMGDGVGAARERGDIAAGVQCFYASATAARCTTRFGWCRGGREWRCWVGRWAAEHGIAEDDVDAMRRLMGPKWAQRLWWKFTETKACATVGLARAWRAAPVEGREAGTCTPQAEEVTAEDCRSDAGWEQLAAREDPPALEAPAVELEPITNRRWRGTLGGKANRGPQCSRREGLRMCRARHRCGVASLGQDMRCPARACQAFTWTGGVGSSKGRHEMLRSHDRTARAPPPARGPPRVSA